MKHYLVRSAVNTALVYCTDGEFRSCAIVGPGTDLAARIYRTRSGASRVRGGVGIVVRECDARGVEV